MTRSSIHVAIVEDHQSIIDGYLFRLSGTVVQIVGIVHYGEEIEALLRRHPVDVLLLDIHVPTSPSNSNPFPIIHLLKKLLVQDPRLKILVISMLKQHSLIEELVGAGIRGYIFKDDYDSIQHLLDIVTAIARGGIYFSKDAYESLRAGSERLLTPRQMEALSLCATYPDEDISNLAKKLDVTSSTYRNLLSATYRRLGVQTRTAAINKAYQLGLLTPVAPAQPGNNINSGNLV